MRKIKYSLEQMQKALLDSKSQADVIRNLGLKINNGNYEAIRFYAQHYELELPAYDARLNTEQAIKRNKISDEEWFTKGTRRSGPETRKKLIRLGHKDECECGQGPEWNGKPLTLQIDHIDGDKFNNEIINLRIICPHCHTQTDTYAANGTKGKKRYDYCECGKQISRFSARCSKCDSKSRIGKTVVEYPPIEEIVELIKSTSFSNAARELGCSDNAIRKHLARNGVDWKNIK